MPSSDLVSGRDPGLHRDYIIPDQPEYIGPLTDLESLVKTWRDYIARSNDPDDRYVRGLTVCADQLAETVERMLADA